jgi:SAM-dependent methyltransferase
MIGSRRRLFGLSFLMLFIELALIRWTGAHVVYLSYFSNVVLLGSFLGIGIGFLRADRRPDLFRAAPFALAGLVAFVTLFPVEIDRSGTDLLFFGAYGPTGLPAWVTLPVVFLAAAAVMATIGGGVAQAFSHHRPLHAYRLDVLGSITGIAAFTLLSFLQLPPMAWGLVACAGLAIALRPRIGWLQGLPLIAVLGLLVVDSLSPGTHWSPYYAVETSDVTRPPITVSVNGVPHQVIESVEDRERLEPIYLEPYARAATSPERVLVVGAGTGGDVAIALREGAQRVDAVEIDPVLADLGRRYNPDAPYADPRVHLFVDDGRAFLERTAETYDLILFALPDSLTLVSGQSSIRLESYLFTREAFMAARDHLAADGVFGVYNYFREPWLIDRFAATMRTAFGRDPCVDAVEGQGRFALLTVGRSETAVSCPSSAVSTGRSAPDPVSDDRPFPYLRHPEIPAFYLAALASVLVAAAVAVRLVGGPYGAMASSLDLFFMGAAFLLLETKNVVGFALLFGTTWVVNALVFAGILVAVLAAIEVKERFRLPSRSILYVALAASLVIAWLVPNAWLLDLPIALRFGAATILAFAPIFLANLVFADRFAGTAHSTTAFAANLLGAMVGGVLEYAALVVGYRALLPLVAMLYAAAFVADRRRVSRTAIVS